MITGIVNTGYEAISAGILAAFLAQVIKFFIFTIKTKKINFKIFTTTGGMPSSHSAAGVRRAAGKTAACLNRMMEDFYKHDVQAIGGKLKELLGHTPFEVIMGAIFGIIFAYSYHCWLS